EGAWCAVARAPPRRRDHAHRSGGKRQERYPPLHEAPVHVGAAPAAGLDLDEARRSASRDPARARLLIRSSSRKRGPSAVAKVLDARFRGHERSMLQAPSFSASSAKLDTAMSTDTVGFVSPVPGPCSSGRATCA